MKVELTREQWAELVEALWTVDAIESADDAKTDYSGRFMYGEPCIRFRLSDDSGDLLRFGVSLADAFEHRSVLIEAGFEIDDWFQAARTDNMGTSDIVLYFPGVTVAPDPDAKQATDDDQDDEDDDDPAADRDSADTQEYDHER